MILISVTHLKQINPPVFVLILLG